MFHTFELEQYLESLVPERSALMQEMEGQALRETIPVVTPAVGVYLSQLVSLKGAKDILEIGTATGYSTLWLAEGAKEHGGRITTIDMNRGRRAQALEYFARAGCAGMISSLVGDARKILPELEQNFDFIFIDAAKGEYLEYLELVLPKLRTGGILVTDNVLFRGWVVPGALYDAKYERVVRKLRVFLQTLAQDPTLQTSVLPLGDGLAVSMKKG